jgi:FMN phosphatase YigB (HAD superfamily)
MEKLRTVFLDWNGTLSVSRFWGHLQEPDHELSHVFPRIEATLFKPKSSLWYVHEPWMRAQMNSEDVVELLAKEIKLEPEKVLQELILSCQNMQFVSDQVPALVNKIRGKGLIVVIATDNMDSFNRWTVPAMGLDEIFDDILVSYDLRGLKGDLDQNGRSLFFNEYLKRHQLLPGESILIDDSKSNSEVAERLGIIYHQIPFGGGLVSKLEEIAANS